MEAPKCKLCGGRHYGLCKAVTKPERIIKTPSGRAASGPVTASEEITPEADAVRAVTNAMEGVRLKFDRNAYQRDYMRKKRAKDRALKAINEARERERTKLHRPPQR